MNLKDLLTNLPMKRASAGVIVLMGLGVSTYLVADAIGHIAGPVTAEAMTAGEVVADIGKAIAAGLLFTGASFLIRSANEDQEVGITDTMRKILSTDASKRLRKQGSDDSSNDSKET